MRSRQGCGQLVHPDMSHVRKGDGLGDLRHADDDTKQNLLAIEESCRRAVPAGLEGLNHGDPFLGFDG